MFIYIINIEYFVIGCLYSILIKDDRKLTFIMN